MSFVVFRDAKGRFAKKEDAISFQEVEAEKWTKPRKVEEYKPKLKKYTYIIGFDYNKRGKHGMHPFHREYRVVSPKPMSAGEIVDYIVSQDSEFADVLSACKFKLKGEEIEDTEHEVNKKWEKISYSH